MTVEAELATVRAAALAQVAALTQDIEGVMAASRSSNADDEHDPEGATIAFERQQLVALLDQARARLADVDAALERAAAGEYGRCTTCGATIAAARLAARPQTRTCIDCAR